MAWALIPPFSCDTALAACSLTNGVQPCCESRDNRGWRYFIAALGVLTLFMFACRFFLFRLFESPKFLLSRGREEEAVSVVQSIAHHNGATTWLTADVLEELAGDTIDDGRPKLTVLEINKRNLSKYSLQKVESLFIDWKLGTTTILLWFIWATIGMGYPLFNAFLPQYLEHVGQGEIPVSAGVVRHISDASVHKLTQSAGLSQLLDHIYSRRPWEHHRLLHCRPEIRWPKRDHGCLNSRLRSIPLPVHAFKLAAIPNILQLDRSLLSSKLTTSDSLGVARYTIWLHLTSHRI